MKRKTIRDFTDLEIYSLALDLAAQIYKLTSKFPNKEKFGITNQLRRASSSAEPILLKDLDVIIVKILPNFFITREAH